MIISLILGFLSGLAFFSGLFTSPHCTIPPNEEVLAPPKFKNLIYLVFDGLRFDGLVPVYKQGKYFNKMSIMGDSTVNKCSFMSISGIPTATKSRIIAMLTGKPSKALDCLSSFHNGMITDDNLINKVSKLNYSFFGDDCWPNNFPALMGRGAILCSFLKYDLVYEENEIFDKFIKEVPEKGSESSKIPSNCVFAHFISLDMCGHEFSIHHTALENVLRRFDKYIRTVYEKMSEDTLFVVVSDHGCTDAGAHGGSSKAELASSCVFFSKTKIEVSDKINPEYGNLLLSFYNIRECNTDKDWLNTVEPYKVISQYDVLPTVCYLLGLPVPSGSVGNIIPYFKPSREALDRLAILKEKHLNIILRNFRKECFKQLHSCPNKNTAGKGGTDEMEDEDPRKYSYEELERYNYCLSKMLFNSYHSTNIILIFVAFGISLVNIIRLYYILPCLSLYIHSIFSIIMTSHSFWAFSSEDYQWFCTLLYEHPTVANWIAFIFYIKVPGREFFESDHIKLQELFPVEGVVRKFSGIYAVLFVTACFLVLRHYGIHITLKKHPLWLNIRLLERNDRVVSSIMRSLPQIAYCLYKIHYPGKNRELCYILLSAFPSIDSLLATHFNPYNSIFLILILPNMDIRYTSSTKYALLSLIPYLCNVEKTVQSINFGVFFTFTDCYDAFSFVPSFIIYFVVLRFVVIRKAYASKLDPDYGFSFLNALGLGMCFFCSWVISDQLVFHLFFFSRLLFVTGYFACDGVLELLIYWYVRWNKKCLPNMYCIIPKD